MSNENNPPLRIDITNQNLTDNDAIRLADALLQSRNDSGIRCGSMIKILRLSGNDISSAGFLAICEAIGGVADASAELQVLDIGNNRVASNVDDFIFAMYLLFSAAPKLNHLDLAGNRIGLTINSDFQLSGEILSMSEQYDVRLETLNLSDNFLCDRAVVHLTERMMISKFKSVTRLNLSWNNIGSSGSRALADMIACNLPLQHLILRHNFVGDAGCKMFASALKTNDTLLQLNLGYNRISSLGTKDLRTAVWNTTSLNTLATSNHSILLYGYHADDFYSSRGNSNEYILETEQILLLHAIQKQNLNLPPIHQMKTALFLRQNFHIKHFHQNRMHIPEVLQFVSSHFGVDKLFHIIREMPHFVCAN